MIIRYFDIFFSALGLLLLSPVFLIIYVLIRLESKGSGFYIQKRIGQNGRPFGLYKFRTMHNGSDKGGLLTVGEHDERITRLGYFLRRYKLDELPQLWNVLRGDMSLVGPRPEVKKYVDLYTDEQRKVLSVKPGITDYASIQYVNENEILGSAEDPEKAYIEKVMPDKIKLNMKYIRNNSVTEYFKIILLTFKSIFRLGTLSRLATWYFNKKSLPFWCIFIMDMMVVYLAYLFVYQQFNSGKDTLEIIEYLTTNIVLYTIFYAIGFKVFRTYSGILRYSSFVDLKKVGLAMLSGGLLTLLAWYLLHHHQLFSYITQTYIVVATILATCVLWMVRIAVKTIFDISQANIDSKYAFIYGVKHGGIAIAKHIRNESPSHFDLRGFVSDDKAEEDRILMGVRVYKLDDRLVSTMVDEGIEALIVSPYRAEAFRNNEKLQDELIKAGIHIYITQEAKEWDSDDAQQKPQLKEISIEDLLPRDEIEVDLKPVCKELCGKRIMVTGSAGSIGCEIVRQISPFKPALLILIDQAETPQHDIQLMMSKEWPDIDAKIITMSVCNAKHIETVFQTFRPEYVFHAAAYKHVPMMEDNPGESIYNNVMSTRLLADLAVKHGTKKFVMISTDKAVNPTNVMGCSKRICEIYVQSLDQAIKKGIVKGQTQFVTTRFGNVPGTNGSVIPLFKKQIQEGGPITVTHQQATRYFMLITEVCTLMLEAGIKGQGGEIFVFDMGKPVKIDDLARRMIKLSGAKNISIRYIGLRPGEKLSGEELNNEETSMPSFHKKIRVAKDREYNYQEVCKQLDELKDIADTYNDMAIVRKMKQIVPEFKSNNSVYDKLDQY